MAAYVIAEIEITDAALYEEYRRLVLPVVQKFGGGFLARGGRIEAMEGGWKPKRLVIVAFPSMERALEWYRSPEYAPLIELRERASRGKLVIVDGA
jgi:uncharacterized protein (DUF1330 family)